MLERLVPGASTESLTGCAGQRTGPRDDECEPEGRSGEVGGMADGMWDEVLGNAGRDQRMDSGVCGEWIGGDESVEERLLMMGCRIPMEEGIDCTRRKSMVGSWLHRLGRGGWMNSSKLELSRKQVSNA